MGLTCVNGGDKGAIVAASKPNSSIRRAKSVSCF